jgi:hypothetical protein
LNGTAMKAENQEMLIEVGQALKAVIDPVT